MTKSNIVPESESQRVIISLEPPDLTDGPDLLIWVKPSDLSWNDFGYISRAVICFIYRGRAEFEYNCKAAYFDPDEASYVGVGNAIQDPSNRRKAIIETSRSNIISLGQDQETYRAIVREYGVETANERLLAAGDLVATTNNGSVKNIEKSALKSQVFQFSLTRESEAFYAFKNAASIIRGLDQEDISSGPERVTVSLSNEPGDDFEVGFNFSHEATVPKRTCVIIGKNGVGKSRVLGGIARKALRGVEKNAASSEGRITASRILAFTPGTEYTNVFPNESWERPATFYKRLSTSRSRSGSARNTATSTILELSRNDRMIAEKSRFSIFLDAVQAINRADQIAFRSNDNSKLINLRALRTKSEQHRLELLLNMNEAVEPGRQIEGKFLYLSSGEARFIKLLAQACTYIENGSLLLLDEPETHLHPNFIARLMSALESLLADTGSCAILATHSVYVVREVFHDQVVIVERHEDGSVSVKAPGMRTFGADISTISTFIFGEEDSSFLAEDVMSRIRSENLSLDELREKYGKILSREILSDLRG